MAVALYRQVGRYIQRDQILDDYTGLPSFGWYASAVELIMLKAQHIRDQLQRDHVLADVIEMINKVWQRKMNPDAVNVTPVLSPEQVNKQWNLCLSFALDLGQPRLMRDNGS